MNITYITTATDLKSVLAATNTYFIVEKEIALEGTRYTLGSGSVLNFEGGSFTGSSDSALDLNGGQVIPAPYPIFINLTVTGFSNSKIYAEWFMSDASEAAHLYINRALQYAKGCPVVLQPKDYELTGTIKFPSSSPSTLISERGLKVVTSGDANWNNNPVAMDIDVSNVTVNIDKIEFPVHTDFVYDEHGNIAVDHKGNPRTKIIYPSGTGIRISGQVFHVSINVNNILYPKYGIDISPGRDGKSANVQYLNIKFQQIAAGYCIYINIFHKDAQGAEHPENVWVTRSSIHGGRLIGNHGVYMEEGTASVNTSHISELRFTSIGFEAMDQTPIFLRNATRLRFEYIRMSESLPDKATIPWFDFKDVTWVDFSINGGIRSDYIKAEGACDRITIRGGILDTTDWSFSVFDAIIIGSVYSKDAPGNRANQKLAISSINPYPMTRVLSQSADLENISPVMAPAATNSSGNFKGLTVLPRMFQVKSGSDISVDINGLREHEPCLYYLYLEQNAKLTLRSLDPRFYPPAGNIDYYVDLAVPGMYQLVWCYDKDYKRIMVLPVSR